MEALFCSDNKKRRFVISLELGNVSVVTYLMCRMRYAGRRTQEECNVANEGAVSEAGWDVGAGYEFDHNMPPLHPILPPPPIKAACISPLMQSTQRVVKYI